MAQRVICPECRKGILIESDDFDVKGILCKRCTRCDKRLVFNIDYVRGITVRKYKGEGKDKVDFDKWIKRNRKRVDWAWGILYE